MFILDGYSNFLIARMENNNYVRKQVKSSVPMSNRPSHSYGNIKKKSKAKKK